MKVLVVATLLSLSLTAAGHAQAARGKPSATTPLSAQEADDLAYLREEEKLARDLYVALDERWHAMVFSNISASEDTHFTTLGDALARYGLADPALSQAGRFSNPDLQALYDTLLGRGQASVIAAYQTGALVEEVDIQDLDQAMAAASHADLDTVYGRLQCGSRNHLRAFVRNLETAGVAYAAQVLPQERVDAILASAMERCGQQ